MVQVEGKKRLMFFKVDFEKVYDSISWDFHFKILGFMDFLEFWINLICDRLGNSWSSILINDSSNHEFSIKRVLKQGDSLSHFLFILAMEGLHVAVKDAVATSIFCGIHVGDQSILLSHFLCWWCHIFLENGLVIILWIWLVFCDAFIWFLLFRLIFRILIFLGLMSPKRWWINLL